MLSIPKTPPEQLVFKPNKLPILLRSIVLWSIILPVEITLYYATYVSGYPTSSDGILAFWLMALVMPVLLFYNVIPFLPKEGWLTLDSSGFQIKSFLRGRNHQYNWDEVQEFFITYQVNRYIRYERISFSTNIAGISREKDFPVYRYHTPTKELVLILNDWKNQYAPTPDRAGVPSGQFSQATLPPIDKRIMDMTNRWGCGLAIIGIILFIVFIALSAGAERTTFKFYNFQPNSSPALSFTVEKGSKAFEVYQLPPIPYKHKLELRIPTPDRRAPIRIQYNLNHQARCVSMQKHYGIWGQTDAIWVNPDGSLDAYASDYCKKTGRRSCRFIPDYVHISDCGLNGSALTKVKSTRDASNSENTHIKIEPLGLSDYNRLTEKTGIDFRD